MNSPVAVLDVVVFTAIIRNVMMLGLFVLIGWQKLVRYRCWLCDRCGNARCVCLALVRLFLRRRTIRLPFLEQYGKHLHIMVGLMTFLCRTWLS